MASRKKGLLITFEGGDGAGKSTQIRSLVRWLKREGHDVLVTRQPGGSALGRRLRHLILTPGHRVCQQAELLMYEADRAQHVEEILTPALAQGKVVVSDRFSDSSTVYQGMCRGLGVEWTESLNRFATRGLEPDVTVVLDVSETVGRGRLNQTRRRLDRIEREASAFHRKVRRSFLELARRHPERMVVLDGSQPKETIAASIRELVKERMKWKKRG